jgi:hypothetical protein
MARASGTKGHQGKQTRAARAKAHRPAGRDVRIPTSKPLNAQRDATCKGQIQRKRRDKSEQILMPLLADRELIELMNRRTRALIDLPIRIARCRTPFDVWREHNQFVQGITTDCQSAAFRVMKAGLQFNHFGRIASST